MKLSDQFILRNICGDSLLVPLGDKSREYNGIFTLSETGAFILTRILDDKDESETASLLSQEFDIDYQSAYDDTVSFISSLKEYGVLTD